MISVNTHQSFLRLLCVSVIFLLSLLVISCGGGADEPASNVPNLPTASVGLSASKIDTRSGNITKVDVVINDFPVTEGGGVTIKYDPDLLQVKNVIVNDAAWDFVNQSGSIDNVKGVVSNILVSSYKGVSGKEVIATIEFEANNTGSGDILLEESLINPFASGGNEVAVEFLKSEINVQAIN